jgi:hypothetical protein
MRLSIVVLLFAGLFALGASAYAGTDSPLDDPSFEQAAITGTSTVWESSSNVIFGAGFERPSIAKDPWPYPFPGEGPTGYIRQIVDNSRSPYWNPALNHKVETVEFDLYTTGQASVQIGFDWWDTYWGDPKPVGPAPLWEVLPAHYTSPNGWTRYSVTYDWYGKPGQTWQPRWTSLEIYFWGSATDEAGVDSLVLTSKCVPEPSSLLAFSGSLLGLAGFALRRKR